MKYTVHLYPIVMVKVEGVEAASQEEAIKKAEAQTDLHFLGTPYLPQNVTGVVYADDIDCFHVDEENDPQYERSCWYDKNGCPL